MTAQIDDIFRYREEEWSIAGISEGEFFQPSSIGLQVEMSCTACRRGYMATYSVIEGLLTLVDLFAFVPQGGQATDRAAGIRIPAKPLIEGVAPSPTEWFFFNTHYERLRHRINYTGGILLARSFISEPYVHMGFHPAWKYERVVKLIFDSGLLMNEIDVSKKMAEFREKVLNPPDGERKPLTHAATRRWIEDSFDRRY